MHSLICQNISHAGRYLFTLTEHSSQQPISCFNIQHCQCILFLTIAFTIPSKVRYCNFQHASPALFKSFLALQKAYQFNTPFDTPVKFEGLRLEYQSTFSMQHDIAVAVVPSPVTVTNFRVVLNIPSPVKHQKMSNWILSNTFWVEGETTSQCYLDVQTEVATVHTRFTVIYIRRRVCMGTNNLEVRGRYQPHATLTTYTHF